MWSFTRCIASIRNGTASEIEENVTKPLLRSFMQHCASSGWLLKRRTFTLEDATAGDEKRGRAASQREIKSAQVPSA